MEQINSFREEQFYLSNFYEAPIVYDGICYCNNEAAFQAQKVTDRNKKLAFSRLNASEAKKLGRTVPLRKDWEAVKAGIMREVVHAKFDQHKDLREKLLGTGNAYLEEGNDWGDRVWGTVDGHGANLLGKILMEERENLRQELSMKLETNTAQAVALNKNHRRKHTR